MPNREIHIMTTYSASRLIQQGEGCLDFTKYADYAGRTYLPQRGGGVGPVFSNLYTSFRPAVKRDMAKTLKNLESGKCARPSPSAIEKETIKAGINAVSDVLNGGNIDDAVDKRVAEAGDNLKKTACKKAGKRKACSNSSRKLKKSSDKNTDMVEPKRKLKKKKCSGDIFD